MGWAALAHTSIMRFICEFWIVAGLVSCGGHKEAVSETEPIVVFAAASLTPIVQHLADNRPPGMAELQLNFAASSTLARQIESGAYADVYLSAHTEWIDWLDERNLVEPDSVSDFASGELVWIVSTDASEQNPFDLDSDASSLDQFTGLLAIGDPSHVPVGRYAKQALQNLGKWDALSSQVLSTVDAPAAVRLVELGEASAAIVYASDAQLSDHITVRARFPKGLCQPILYQAALLRGASANGRMFIEQLLAPAAANSLKTFGFQPLTP